MGLVVILYAPSDRNLLACFHHELCHALCQVLLGPNSRNDWAKEGYAGLVGARCCNPLSVAAWKESLSRQRHGTRLLAIAELLYGKAQTPRGELNHLYYLQARLLVAFLHAHRQVTTQAWQVCRRALSDEVKPREVLATLEAAFDRRGDDLDSYVWDCWCASWESRESKESRGK
jgi:hypothetical protein